MRRNWLFWAFLVTSALLLANLVRGLTDLIGSGERFEKAEREVSELEETKKSYESALQGGDKDFLVEKEIRDQLGLAKPGELVVVLPNQEGLYNDQLADTEEIGLEEPNWQKWWKLFF